MQLNDIEDPLKSRMVPFRWNDYMLIFRGYEKELSPHTCNSVSRKGRILKPILFLYLHALFLQTNLRPLLPFGIPDR